MDDYLSAIENAVNAFDIDELRELLRLIKESEARLEDYLNDLEEFLKEL